MGSEKGKITSKHPCWLDVTVPPEYEDNDLYEIILFFVIHSPCPGQSANGVSLSERGWKKHPWHSPKYLKDKLDEALFGNNTRIIKMVEKKVTLKDEMENLNLDDNFYCYRTPQRALFTKSNAKGCGSEYMSLFYHLRNALAHGRLAMYPAPENEIVFVLEDGKSVGNEKDDQFEVSARMILNKSSLLKVIKVLKNPPVENDYSDDILEAIKEGHNTKCEIIKELEIDESTYKKHMCKLKACGTVSYERARWVINSTE